MNELRQTKIEMLEYVADILSNRSYPICYGLDEAYSSKSVKRNRKLKMQAEHELKEYISCQLGDAVFYSFWVIRKVGNEYNKYSLEERVEKTRLGRLAWVNWMIQCLKEDQAREDAE